MKFEWDARKNQLNIGKYGFDFADTARIFGLPLLSALDERDYGEERWIGIGMLDSRVIVVVYTEPDKDTVRIISLRKALSHERSAMSNSSKTDWSRIDAMTDEDIDTSDIPPLDDEFFAKAELRMPASEVSVVAVPIDAETLSWFQAKGQENLC